MPSWKKVIISGSNAELLSVTSSFKGNLTGTSSYATLALSASYAPGGSGVTINNNTNNYIVTATGTSNTLNGESNLTFDGTTLVNNLMYWYKSSASVPSNTLGFNILTITPATAGMASIDYWADDGTNYGSGTILIVWDGTANASAQQSNGPSIGPQPQLMNFTAAWSSPNVNLTVDNMDMTNAINITMKVTYF